MKQAVKELLNEMIDYEGNINLPQEHLKKAHDEMELSDFAFTIRGLLGWLKLVSLDLESIGQYEIDSLDEKRHVILFSLSSVLNDLFFVEGYFVKWQASVTTQEKEEIRTYVDENYKVEVRIRMRR